jgi:hypothetical protein
VRKPKPAYTCNFSHTGIILWATKYLTAIAHGIVLLADVAEAFYQIAGKREPMKIFCDNCKSNAAEIFQVNGDYCLNCWQEITHTAT